MDAVPPPISRWQSDWWRLTALIAFSISIHAWLITHTEVTARDAIGFVRYALHLEVPPESQTTLEVIQQAEQPPGYSALICLVAQIVRPWHGGALCDSMMLSAQMSAALAAVLTIFPMYFMGRRLFDRDIATLATGLFQMLPVYAQISSDGLADSLFLLMVCTSLYFAVCAIQDRSTLGFLWAGMASGGAYLVRPEGIILVGAVGVIIGSLWLRGVWRLGIALEPSTVGNRDLPPQPPLTKGGIGGVSPGINLGTTLGYICVLLIGLLITALPYIVTIGGLTNKPTGGNLLNWIQGKEMEPSWQGAPEASRPVNLPLAAWWHEPTHQGQSRMIWAAKSFAGEALKSGHYLPATLALIGIGMLYRRWRHDPALALLVVLMGLHMGLLWVMAVKIGYLSERHTLLIVMVGCYFAAAIVPPWGRWVASWALIRRGDDRHWTRWLIILLIATTLPGALKSLHANRAGHRHAGLWLRQHVQPGEVIYDPFCWAQYYAGYGWIIEPFPPPGSPNPLYVIVEPNNNPHSRLPMYPQAKLMAKAGEPVYHWPEDKPLDDAKVVVYYVVPEPVR